MLQASLVAVLGLSGAVHTLAAAPPGFPASGNGIWFEAPGVHWGREWLPVGNGYLAAMVPGGVVQEATQLNIESLWSGGPMADPSYNGGNHQPDDAAELAQWMQTYRQNIMEASSGTISDVDELATDAGAYGSYAGAGYLLSTLDFADSSGSNYTDFARWLDMDTGVASTTFTVSGTPFVRQTFCSHPAQACVQHLTTTSNATLPATTVAWSEYLETDLALLPNVTCLDNTTLSIRGLIAQPGMLYEILVRAQADGDSASISCSSVPVTSTIATQGPGANATLSIVNATSTTLTWVGGTNYDIAAGDAAHAFSFTGADPHDALVSLLTPLATASYASLLAAHTADFTGALSKFSLTLGDGTWSAADTGTPTDQLRAAYAVDTGNPYLEWLTFNLGRYMLLSSARGVLPANLQGIWANLYSSAWSADYHANINTQMNYWAAEMTNLDVTQSLWDYMEKTWVPRGSYTAQVLYNESSGWVTHNEMNIFGHTGMKSGGAGSAQWADYPESNAWMMLHVWDHFDYTNDVAWFRAQGYPLLKGVAQFHLAKLIPDTHFNDSTLVVAPCNSPEQLPITLGCAHAQQLIWMLFNAIEKGYNASGDTDTAFLQEVQTKKAAMDKGIHIGSFGQLQEWKVDMDSPTDTHRHLSHLIGLYPGYAVASYAAQANYSAPAVRAAAETSLVHRGNGTGPDADAGWEKVWRAACWAQLGNASEFYHELTYTLSEDFGPNLFSLYDPADADPIFQIDANLGFPAAVLNALLQAPDTPTLSSSTPLVVTLLPALPANWPAGRLAGARVRGGVGVTLAWAGGLPTEAQFDVAAGVPAREVQVMYAGRQVAGFTTGGDAATYSVSSF